MTIAVVLSNTAEGSAALQQAAAEALRRSTSLIAIHVFTSTDTHVIEAEKAAARERIETALATGSAGAVEWELRAAAQASNAADTIVDLTIETGAELLVIGSRRRSPAGKFFMGSTVQRVILDATVPVLVVKAPENG